MANYGKILPLQTHYGNNQQYWAVAGSGGGSTSNIINTASIYASTIALNQTGGYGNYALDVSGEIAQANVQGGFPGLATVRVNGFASQVAVSGCNVTINGYVEPGRSFGFETSGALNNINRLWLWNTDAGYNQLDMTTYSSGTPIGSTKLTHYENGSSNSMILSDGAGNDLAGIRMSATGGGDLFAFPNVSTITAQAQTFVANQIAGVGTQYQTNLFNGNKIDVAGLMPLATVLDGEMFRFSTDSKIAKFGAMAPGNIYQPIPTTTWSGATSVELAPYTTFQLYTSPIGSGTTIQYINQGNANFSTFTVDPLMNGTAWNSYKMFMGD